MNNSNMNRACGCNNGTPCQPLEPIVMPPRVCNVVRIHSIEQPIICTNHTHVIHRYVPYNRYYYQYTTDEETQCPGQANNGNNNNFGM